MQMDIDTLAERFQRDGYLVLEDFLDREAAQHLGAELAQRVADGRAMNRDTPAKRAYERERETVVDVFPATDLAAAQAVFHHPQLMALTSAILGPAWRWNGEPSIFSTPAPGGCQGWHQDTRDPGDQQFVLNRICFPFDLRDDQGALFVVPGSHRRGDIPPGGNHEAIDGQVEVRPRAGTVVLMHSRCYHRVAANTGRVPRIQVNLRARPAAAAGDLAQRPMFRTGAWDFAVDHHAGR